jgi:hypothetical protein
LSTLCMAGDDKTAPSRRVQDRGNWKTPCPPYAIDLIMPKTLKDREVEDILATVAPKPVIKTHCNR